MATKTVRVIETEQSLMQEMEITDREIGQRKAFLEFHDEDAKQLQSINELAVGYAEPVIESFYRHLLSFDETRAFFQEPKVLERVKHMQKEYFLGLTQGNYDAGYIADRLKIGAVHERIGLPIQSYLGAYNFYLRAVAARLFDAYKKEPERALAALVSLTKLIFLDIGLAIETYLFQRERTIRLQQQAIRELSTPVLQLRERLLVLPIIGAIDSRRAQQLTEQLLRAIRANRAKAVVIDITGVPAVDSKVANHLIQTVEAARLMGATAIVTGLSAEVAGTLVAIGVDLSKMATVGDLQGGIELADRLIGSKAILSGEMVSRNEPP